MNSDIGFVGLRVGGVAQAHSDIRTGIFFGVSWRRQQFTQIKISIAGEVNHFLAYRRALYYGWANSIFNGIFQQMSQFCRFTLQELANALARAVQTDGHADIVEPLNFVKDHDRAVLARWALAGAAGAT